MSPLVKSPFGVLGDLSVPMGLGLLRLSTEGRPTEAEAISVIHAALDAGIRLLDTADSYGLDEKDLHYGELLVRKALDAWEGPREDVRVITKAGLSRPKGRWVPDGRPESLRRAVEGSLLALGVEQLFLHLLHVNDPRVPFEDQLGTLAELQREGKIAHLGLSNVSIPEVRQAERHFTVQAIQNELSVMDRKSATEGVLALAQSMGVPFLAHRPLGGHANVAKLAKNRAVAPIVARHGITPYEAALAVVLDTGAVPIVGATRATSVASSMRALSVRLDQQDRAALAEKISLQPTPQAAAAVAPPVTPSYLRKLHPGEGPGESPEVVLLVGIQGAGKSEYVTPYLNEGYARLNRDLLGGSLNDLLPRLTELLSSGEQRVILDNTYPTRVSRYPILRAAHAEGVPVRCRYLATPPREAMVNVVHRILDRYGRLLSPDELKELAKTDPNLPPPAALLRWAASFEPPALDEGFGAVEEIPFVRRPVTGATGKGLLLDVDGTIRTTRSGEIYPRDPEDVELLPGRREALKPWVEAGYQLFFVSNQSGVASEKVSFQAVEAALARTAELLDLPITEALFCPHPAFPVGCFCRKPLPGMGVYLQRKHSLSPDHLVMVGDMESDRQFAEAISATYYTADTFFGPEPPRP